MKIHFIGIGGIGVSALAQYYLAKGHTVSGSDLVSSEITEALKKLGAKISIGKNIIKKDADLTIYSPAVKIGNQPYGEQAGKLKSPVLSYPEALGELTKQYFTIAIAGTSGKSTTTAILSLILIKAGLDPTVIIGTKLKEFGDSNCRVGKSKYLVIEADEHMASFLNYWPKIIVLTNIQADHLDYYKNIKNVRQAFKKFIAHLPADGVLITAKQPGRGLTSVVKVPGRHNLLNATLALKAARALKVPDKVSFKALSEYRGAWRRFEILQTKPFVLVSDYGHNPQKAMATLRAAREKWPKKKIWCVYQPHQYQRTFYLFDDFVKTFRKATVDKIIITDIYDVAGREEKNIKRKVTSRKLVEVIARKNVVFVPQKKLSLFLKKQLKQMEVLIIMGAGDIYQLAYKLIDKPSLLREN